MLLSEAINYWFQKSEWPLFHFIEWYCNKNNFLWYPKNTFRFPNLNDIALNLLRV